jgi:hypothetical protein
MILSQTTRALFSGDAVTATSYVYNTDGWVNTDYNHLDLYVAATPLTATTLYFRVEGRDGASRVSSLYVSNMTATITKKFDRAVAFTHSTGLHPAEIRVGVKVNNAATPNNFYCNLVMTEER